MNFVEIYGGKKKTNIQFHKNESSGRKVVPCRQTDITKLTIAFPIFGNASKNWEVEFDYICSRGQLKCDGTREETRFRLSGETDESI